VFEPVVATGDGRVRGRAFDHGVTFRGIPYAAPPVGPRRFRPPHPPERWVGVRDCARWPVTGEEDVLYLSLWTPGLDRARRPVVVWTANGRYFHGRAFARDGVVLVTAGYRAAPFASLYVDELVPGERGTGNLPLLDLVAVLEWVRDNVEAFGGDPDNVTVFGASHGGRFASALMASPLSAGLLHRVIAMSLPRRGVGAAEPAARRAERFLAALGLRAGDWDALGDVPADDVLEAAWRVGPGDPVIVDGAVLDGDPVELVAGGRAASVDLLTGCTADEARYTMFPGDELGPLPGNRTDPDQVRDDIAAWFAPTGLTVDNVLATYAVERLGATELDLLAAVSTDHFRMASLRLAEAQLAHRDRVWVSRFSWRSPIRGGVLGAFHWMDTAFAFDMLDEYRKLVGEHPPHELARAYHGALVRFAACGDPGGGGLPTWPAYDLLRRPVMDFDATCRLVLDPDPEERRLWEGARL
jgi:para-nitrobenzyl esterase